MKQSLKALALLALLPTSSAFADISCFSGINSLNVKDTDPFAVEVSLGIGRGALNFKGALSESNGLQVLGELIYSLQSQYGDPASLKVATQESFLEVYGCGRRICFPDSPESKPKKPLTPKIEATLEIGAENKALYQFNQCSKVED